MQRLPSIKLSLDDIYITLAASIVDGADEPEEPIAEMPLRQHPLRHPSPEPELSKKKPSEEDLETARFNEDNLNRRSFPELQSIRTIQLHSPKILTITGENCDFYRGEG